MHHLSPSAVILAETIVKLGLYKRGEFILSSGKQTDTYIDLRPMILSTSHCQSILCEMIPILADHDKIRLGPKDLLCGVLTSGLVLTGALLHRMSVTSISVSAIYCRTEHRGHGSKQAIEGPYKIGQEVIIVDDVATTSRSIVRVATILKDHGLQVKAALVIVDREEGAKENLATLGIPLYSVLTQSQIAGLDNPKD